MVRTWTPVLTCARVVTLLSSTSKYHAFKLLKRAVCHFGEVFSTTLVHLLKRGFCQKQSSSLSFLDFFLWSFSCLSCVWLALGVVAVSVFFFIR